MPNPIRLAVLNLQTMAVSGLDPRVRSSIPPSIWEHHRGLLRGVYRGARKKYKAWRRFARACRVEARALCGAAPHGALVQRLVS